MNIIDLILRTLKLDLLDLGYASNYILGKERKANFISILLSNFKRTIYLIGSDIKIIFRSSPPITGKDICYYGTQNQYIALSPIVRNIETARFSGINNKNDLHLYTAIGFILSWFFLPILCLKYFRKPETKEKLNLAAFIDKYFWVFGTFIWFVIYFKWKKPRSVFVANDHSLHYRLIKEVCKYSSVPICYIQHASVTDKFPKLDFDLSLLEGKDAYNKYDKKGINSKVYLIGMPKFDGYLEKINTSQKFETLGIAINLLDQKKRIEDLINQLNNSLNNINVILRPHPRDKRISFFKEKCEKYNYLYSDSREENSFDFLQKTDVVIAGETSIHLEAVLMNVYPIYYRLGDKITDLYGYLEKDLVTNIYEDPNKISGFLKNLQYSSLKSIRQRGQYYVSTIGTEFDGRSGQLINDIVNEELG